MVRRQDASTGQIIDDGVAAPDSSTTPDGKPLMNVKIYSPFQIYFDEKAFSVSAANATGPFDILPRHHNFMSLLGNCELRVTAPNGDKRIRISGGLLLVNNDVVKIFLDV